ncbi:hypothetical protein PAL_GLEAN10014314 [Pteropus alecto]|uniref:Uncharacterized protein n=1 Tax=Pteropus alecto TaxID=9402 RepID=L5L1H1_PTEAL|nr:hypothetical protein PAL_GLEAN10014314 [Pteropus alecto]
MAGGVAGPEEGWTGIEDEAVEQGGGIHPGEAALEFVGVIVDKFLKMSQQGPWGQGWGYSHN